MTAPRKRPAAPLAVLAVAAALLGCGGPGPGPDGARAERPEASGGAASEKAPARIVTLAPNLTEIAFALGLGDRVVGVSEYTTWPPEATERPRLGGLFDPNLEAIVSLEPDLALLLPSQAEVAARLGRTGVETLTIEIETVDDVATALRTVGKRCGTENEGRKLADALRRALAPRPIPGAPRVMLSVDRAPGRTENLLAAGPDTYLHELLTRLGAENVFADAPVRYPQVGMEEVLDRAPEAIVELRANPVPPEIAERLRTDWEGYPSLPAVARGSVTVVAESYALIPGPRLPKLYDRLEEAIRASLPERPAEPGGDAP